MVNYISYLVNNTKFALFFNIGCSMCCPSLPTLMLGENKYRMGNSVELLMACAYFFH